MFLLAILALLFFIQLFACTWYTIVKSGEAKANTLKYTLLCSVLCIATVLLCATIYKAYTSLYFMLLVAGLVVSLSGDVISDLKLTLCYKATFITRSTACLIYSVAIISTLFSKSDLELTKLLPLLPCLALTAALVPFMCKKSGSYKPLLIIQVFTACLMINSGIYVGFLCVGAEAPVLQSGGCALIIGVLVTGFANLLNTRQQIAVPPPNKPQLPKNVSYFFGQMVLACTLMITTFDGGLQ